MPATWHWGEIATLAHAQLDTQPLGLAICGATFEGPALMRPPLGKVRCPVCETFLSGESEWFPNKYRKSSHARWYIPHEEAGELLLPAELSFVRIEICLQRSLEGEGLIPFIQVVQNEKERWHPAFVDPLGMPTFVLEDLAKDFAALVVWDHLDRFLETEDILD